MVIASLIASNAVVPTRAQSELLHQASFLVHEHTLAEKLEEIDLRQPATAGRFVSVTANQVPGRYLAVSTGR